MLTRIKHTLQIKKIGILNEFLRGSPKNRGKLKRSSDHTTLNIDIQDRIEHYMKS